MKTKPYSRFYIIFIAIMLMLSAYPLYNGIRMVVLSLRNGVIEPGQYAKYVVPYAAICFSLILFAVFQPLLFKLRRFAFPSGFAAAIGVFFAVEVFIERIKVNTAGLTPIDPPTLTPGSVNVAPGTVDIWQAALCIASPAVREQTVAFSSQDSFYYVMENNAYKIHYYLISILLITMVSALGYGIGKLIRTGGQAKPLILRGMSTATLIALCIFANTTAFFRQTAEIQTPLASVLTCLFFVMLGVSVGLYSGSYLLDRRKTLGMGAPVLISLITVIAMYIGEAVMMDGSLYRFGTGWFFRGLPGIVLAPTDVLVILLSGGLTWLILGLSRKRIAWPGKNTVLITVVLSATVAVSGVMLSAAAALPVSDELFGCYVFDECLYTSPLSSFSAHKLTMLPYVYGLSEDSLIIAHTGSGDIERHTARYEKTPVSADDFLPKSELFSFIAPPDVSNYNERYLLANISDGYRLYQMDGDLWLVRGGTGENAVLWSIYRLKKTDIAALADLERAAALQESRPSTEPSPGTGDRQMKLEDIYALARKGESLVLQDFEPFDYNLAGSDFTVRRYDVQGATVTVLTDGQVLQSARLMSWRTLDESMSIDLREGFEAVAAYLNPLYSLDDITIEDGNIYNDTWDSELIYDYDYDGCRYYINTGSADKIYVVFKGGERIPIKQALKERRITIEDAVSHGLVNVFMVPADNPLGGEFVVLHHLYTFTLDGESFYPSKSFMYVVWGDDIAVYYDAGELVDILECYGWGKEAKVLRYISSTSNLPVIAGRTYISDSGLAEIGLATSVGWVYNSHTPVSFNVIK